MQSVLITGGAGFIGQNLVHAWRRARPDDRLTVIDAMTYAANVRSLQPLIADGSIAFVKGDIRDAQLVRRLFEEHRFDRVAHLAAESHVMRFTARSSSTMPPSPNRRPIAPIRPMPPARPRATIWSVPSSRPTGCRR